MNGSVPLTTTEPSALAEVDQALERQLSMVRNLCRALSERQAGPVSLIETHISFVLVGLEHAYKIKKALRTPFLDQSTLALRQRACLEEMRLNTRLAPELYLAAVPITGTVDDPDLSTHGPTIDFAVKMRAFSQEGLWETLAARGALRAEHVDDLVRQLVPFHATAAVAPATGRLGTAAHCRAPLLQSLDDIDTLVGPGPLRDSVGRLRAWESAAFASVRTVMARRLARRRVRECHGDLHLGNVTLFEGRSVIFDGIDFSDDLRWIDVMSEIAFMAMDLHACGLSALAHRFVNGYLELSGDYGGARVLNYYLVYRALVRAKVKLLRAAQCAKSQPGDAAIHRAAAANCIDCALTFSRRDGRRPTLMLTHGFSGSGKSTLTQGLVEASGAIRIRADVERKRLAGVAPSYHGGARTVPELYSWRRTSATYGQLARQAVAVLAGGWHVVLDATYLRRTHRDRLQRLAARLGVQRLILDFEADPEVLSRRLQKRSAQGDDASDADEAVLAMQMRTAEPLQPDEVEVVFRCRARSTAGEIGADWTSLITLLDASPSA